MCAAGRYPAILEHGSLRVDPRLLLLALPNDARRKRRAWPTSKRQKGRTSASRRDRLFTPILRGAVGQLRRRDAVVLDARQRARAAVVLLPADDHLGAERRVCHLRVLQGAAARRRCQRRDQAAARLVSRRARGVYCSREEQHARVNTIVPRRRRPTAARGASAERVPRRLRLLLHIWPRKPHRPGCGEWGLPLLALRAASPLDAAAGLC